MRTISREEIKRRIDAQESIILVEALPEKYYNSGHLPGAINIPHSEIRSRAASELPDKNATIIVYCANTQCQNSHTATQTLNEMGYRRVFEYVEGKQDWADAGLPLEVAETA